MEEPYSALGYFYVGDGGGEQVRPGVPDAVGDDAIVDRVVVEWREAVANGSRVATCSTLLQRDGDVVGMDGVSPITFTVAFDLYYLSIKHRNHLGVMTSIAYFLGPDAVTLDLSDPLLVVWGAGARKFIGDRAVLWSGEANGNGQVRYTGVGNDRDPILNLVGGAQPNVLVTGYHRQDVNMDGQVKYTGAGHDRDRALLSMHRARYGACSMPIPVHKDVSGDAALVVGGRIASDVCLAPWLSGGMNSLDGAC